MAQHTIVGHDSAPDHQEATRWLIVPCHCWNLPETLADTRRLLQARRGYQAMLSERLGAPTGQLTAASGALVSCAALFELLLPAVGGSAAAEVVGEVAEGTAAAVAIYEQALATSPVEASPFTLKGFCFCLPATQELLAS